MFSSEFVKLSRTVVVVSKNITYYMIKNYVGHKSAIFNTVLLLLTHCIYCWPDDETWDSSMMQCDFEKNKQIAETCVWNKKKYCSCCIILIRIDTILSKFIYNNFQNILFKKLHGSWATKQTYFGNLICS